MDIFYRIIAILGGLSLFLYGMRIMGDGLKSGSGGAMQAVLSHLTKNPVMSFLLGVLVTCMIQSSTATIVLTVGLVGAGYLTFRQSIGIVLGANVGTSITAQIIRLMDVSADAGSILYFFKSDNLAPLALTIGIVLIMFVKSKASGPAGTVFMGFGILFVGLMNMSAAVSTFGDSLSGLLTSFEGNYVLGFLSGVLVTGVIQSSSAVVGILQSVASSVGIKFSAVFPVIIGVNIGDCITTYLVCRLGAKPEQIRTCLVHIIYNVIAAVMLFAGVSILKTTGILPDSLWNATLNSGGVANVHGLFRLIPAILLLPFTGMMAGIAEKIVPDAKVDAENELYEKTISQLDIRLIENPGLALAEADNLISYMGDVALQNFEAAVDQLFSYDEARDERIDEREELLDRMADASSKYLVATSPHILLESDHRQQSFLIQALSCFERMGDIAVHMTNNVKRLHASGSPISDTAVNEITTASDAIREILTLAISAYKTGDLDLARKVEPLEEVNDEMIEEIRTRHVHRMTQGQCNVINGIEFQNILQNFERLSDQCSDLAVYLLGRTDDSINGKEHLYIHELHHSGDPAYQKLFDENYKKYFDRLNKGAA